MESTRIWLARTIAAEFDELVLVLARWLEAREGRRRGRVARRIVSCFASWLWAPRAVATDRVVRLVGRAERRSLARAALNEGLKGIGAFDTVGAHRRMICARLLDGFFDAPASVGPVFADSSSKSRGDTAPMGERTDLGAGKNDGGAKSPVRENAR